MILECERHQVYEACISLSRVLEIEKSHVREGLSDSSCTKDSIHILVRNRSVNVTCVSSPENYI